MALCCQSSAVDELLRVECKTRRQQDVQQEGGRRYQSFHQMM